MGGTPIGTWLIFGVIIAAALVFDLIVFRPKEGQAPLKRALAETAAWIGISLLFGLWIYLSRGRQAGLEFLTAYVVEKSLSIDNIFVFLVIFQAFGIAARYQHKVLYSGIIGALVLRMAFVVAGIALLRNFHVLLYVFGALLVVVGIKMMVPGKHTSQPEDTLILRLARKIHPVATSYRGEFWVREAGKRMATPLLLALVAIEISDIVFAVDSVPAVLAITRDTFIAYSSNVFAILGLRAMYFALADLMPRARFLHHGLAGVLIFVGAKMLLSERFPLSSSVSLGIIMAILGIATGASWIAARKAH